MMNILMVLHSQDESVISSKKITQYRQNRLQSAFPIFINDSDTYKGF